MTGYVIPIILPTVEGLAHYTLWQRAVPFNGITYAAAFA